ncbi:MAG: hypothetical protein MH204_06615 [Fimbriimonadaceae bacterium]|nr:hypothetical protein [Fimbriimonadaceae bacterium]
MRGVRWLTESGPRGRRILSGGLAVLGTVLVWCGWMWQTEWRFQAAITRLLRDGIVQRPIRLVNGLSEISDKKWKQIHARAIKAVGPVEVRILERMDSQQNSPRSYRVRLTGRTGVAEMTLAGMDPTGGNSSMVLTPGLAHLAILSLLAGDTTKMPDGPRQAAKISAYGRQWAEEKGFLAQLGFHEWHILGMQVPIPLDDVGESLALSQPGD